MDLANKLSLKIEGAEHVLNILVERGTIKFSESEKILEPMYNELRIIINELKG